MISQHACSADVQETPNKNMSTSSPKQPHMRHTNHGQLSSRSDADDAGSSIGLSHKVLSATSGSLITSFLDVVRVRLQSQHTTVSAASPAPTSTRLTCSPLPMPYTFSNIPHNLGISRCCREVFYISNNAQNCLGINSGGSVVADHGIRSSAICAVEQAQSRAFTSTFEGLRKIAQNEGLRTLWRGLSPTLLMAVPANVIYFTGYDWLRMNRDSPFQRMKVKEAYVPLLAGSSARMLAAFVVSPIELFRTRMQAVHTEPGIGGSMVQTMQGMKDLIAFKGFRSLWTGLNLTLWRDAPFSAAYWWGYEFIRERLRHARHSQPGPLNKNSSIHASRESLAREDNATVLIDSFIAGSTSGACAAFMTTPFDVGKTRLQTIQYSKEATKVATPTPLTQEKSMSRLLLHIFETEGISGLFRGWTARCLKVAPACAIMISSYEVGKKMAATTDQ